MPKKIFCCQEMVIHNAVYYIDVASTHPANLKLRQNTL